MPGLFAGRPILKPLGVLVSLIVTALTVAGVLTLSPGATVTGDLIPTTDNTYDVGTSTLRWRSGFFGTSVSSTLFIASQGTNSAPSYSFTNDSDTGIYNGAGNEISMASGGTIRLAVSSAGVVLRSSSSFLAGSNNVSDIGASATKMRSGYFGTSLQLGSSATGIQLYNTSDETTNYERVSMGWAANLFSISGNTGGTGTNRQMSINTAGSNLTISGDAGTSQFNFNRTTGGSITAVVNISGTMTQSSGILNSLRIGQSINQSGTAGYTSLLINPTETATGSGAKNLILAQVGSVDKFTVTNAGIVSAGGGSANKAMCWKTDGITLGYCSSVVDVAGGCTCN